MTSRRRTITGKLAVAGACAVLAAVGNVATAAAAVTAPGWSSGRAAACASALDASLTALDRTDVTGGSGTGAAARLTRAASCLRTATAEAPAPVRVAAASAATDAGAALSATGADRSVLRGAAAATLRVAAAHAVLDAATRADVPTARAWLTLRERRASTRIGVPDAPAAAALASLADGDSTPAAATARIEDDLLGTTMVVLRGKLDSVVQRADAGLDEGAAVTAAEAAAMWRLLDPAWRAARPTGTARPATAADRLAAAARATPRDAAAIADAATALDTAIAGFAPGAVLDDSAAAETAARVSRFVGLVPVEYGRGVRDGKVTLELELQEARSFLRGAFDAWSALEPVAIERDPGAAAKVGERLEQLDVLVTRAETTPDDAPAPDDVRRAADRVHAALAANLPDDWLEGSATADLALVRSALTNVSVTARRGDWRAAEQSRVEAYGAFEFGPELRLRAIDPALAVQVEELIWYGDGPHAGLASLVAARAAHDDFEPTLAALDQRLDRVEARLGETATPGAVRTNSAIIVLREGMEAVLILAALTAGLAGAGGGRLRRPIIVGGLLALLATAITFVVARALLGSLARFGERLEVVVSLVAIGVLLLILNWFVHKAYWTGWMAGFQKRKVAIAGTARERREGTQMQRVSAVAQVGGLIVLGFTSIYREGFETVLFLQALVLDTGTAPVLEGAAIGLLGVALLAVLTMRLQRRLPYRKMLIVTGVLIAVVLASMVGGTVQAMQAVGWMSVHPIAGLHVPAWASTWLGVHPTWEAISLQFAAIVFVIGSYVVAEWWQEQRRARRRAGTGSAAATPAAADGEYVTTRRAAPPEPAGLR